MTGVYYAYGKRRTVQRSLTSDRMDQVNGWRSPKTQETRRLLLPMGSLSPHAAVENPPLFAGRHPGRATAPSGDPQPMGRLFSPHACAFMWRPHTSFPSRSLLAELGRPAVRCHCQSGRWSGSRDARWGCFQIIASIISKGEDD